MGGRTVRKLLWRWRSNPLRRHDDIVESWIVLVVLLVITLGGAAAGFVTAHAADGELARQRAERHSAHAVLVAGVPSTASAGGSSERVSAEVRWTAPDGTTRSGRTLVNAGQKAGARVVVWLDAKGALATEPPGPTEAAAEAALLGLAAALATTGLAVGAGALARWRLDRRRLDQWGREWDLVGPQWGHKTG
ncbi:Rv1733c family protein [Streptomyces sp. 7R007]